MVRRANRASSSASASSAESPCAPLCAALIAAVAGVQQAPAPAFTPDTVVRIDIGAFDARGRFVETLTAADFELREDGAPQAIEAVRLSRAGAAPRPFRVVAPAPPTTEQAEARQPGARLFAIYLDEYHVSAGDATARVREALTRFVDRDLGPRDLLVVMKPLDSVLAIRLTHDREAAPRRDRDIRGTERRLRTQERLRAELHGQHACRRRSDADAGDAVGAERARRASRLGCRATRARRSSSSPEGLARAGPSPRSQPARPSIPSSSPPIGSTCRFTRSIRAANRAEADSTKAGRRCGRSRTRQTGKRFSPTATSTRPSGASLTIRASTISDLVPIAAKDRRTFPRDRAAYQAPRRAAAVAQGLLGGIRRRSAARRMACARSVAEEAGRSRTAAPHQPADSTVVRQRNAAKRGTRASRSCGSRCAFPAIAAAHAPRASSSRRSDRR